MTPSLYMRIYEVVRHIPLGKVATYGQVARLAGAPRSARMVGWALHQNPEPGIIPCHRVVFKSGSVCSGFAFGGAEEQELLLRSEGVYFAEVSADMLPHVDLERSLWDGKSFNPSWED